MKKLLFSTLFFLVLFCGPNRLQAWESTKAYNEFQTKSLFLMSTTLQSLESIPAPTQNTCLEDASGELDIVGTTGKVGQDILIPVRIQTAPKSISSLGFEFIYDANIVEYSRYERGNLASSFTLFDVNPVEPGRLIFGGVASDSPIPEKASGYLMWLTFKVKDGIGSIGNISGVGGVDSIKGKCTSLTLENIEDDIARFSLTGGCFCIPDCNGDLNGDGSVTPKDALITFQCYLKAGPCGDCTDVNQDSKVTPADALCLFRKYLKQPSCLDEKDPNRHSGQSTPTTPRENEEAELMALCLSGEMAAPDTLYTQVLNDLSAIRSAFGSTFEPITKIVFKTPWSPSCLLIGFDEATDQDVRQGKYHGWDDLNKECRLSKIDTQRTGYVILYFEGRLHPRRLAERYAALPGVRYAEPNITRGDSPKIYPRLTEGGITYLFRDAWGDCPSGCTFNRYWYFIFQSGQPKLVGQWASHENPQTPQWWNEAKQNIEQSCK